MAQGPVSSAAPTPPAAPGGGYESAQKGLEKIAEWFSTWSQRLSDTSVQLGYALVGANWAVFGSVDKLMSNPAARLSLGLAVIFFAVNLAFTRTVTELLRDRYRWAEKHPAEWAKEFESTRGKDHPWPSTRTIDSLSWLLREVRTWLPLASGAAFLAALW